MAERVGFKPTGDVAAPPTDLQSDPISHSGIPPKVLASSSGLTPCDCWPFLLYINSINEQYINIDVESTGFPVQYNFDVS